MIKNIKKQIVVVFAVSLAFSACKSLDIAEKKENRNLPAQYEESSDTLNSAQIIWKTFLNDPYLNELIDTALINNQELNLMLQEISIARNEVRAKKGEYLPFLTFRGGASVDRVGKYTRNGAVESNLPIKSGVEFPDPLTDYTFGAYANWEVDIWRKLRNAKKSAAMRYLATVEGKNFMVTNLVAEIATSYYELLALDNQVTIVKKNIDLRQTALRFVKQQKDAAKVTELAVLKFEAEVYKNQSHLFILQQQVIQTENNLNLLIGRFPRPITRSSNGFLDRMPQGIATGIPAQLLAQRPDIRQAELQLEAAKLDVKVARANFYPSLSLGAGLGYQAFNPKYIMQTPESMLYSLAGDIISPLVNRNGIKATYYSANAKQIQAVYNYERSILTGYTEVLNQLNNVRNLQLGYDLKAQQVRALTESIAISVNLFNSARADYMEVLLTQRDALEARIEQIEVKQQQMNAVVKIYQALGGGWN